VLLCTVLDTATYLRWEGPNPLIHPTAEKEYSRKFGFTGSYTYALGPVQSGVYLLISVDCFYKMLWCWMNMQIVG
jgi:hypothetical protein